MSAVHSTLLEMGRGRRKKEGREEKERTGTGREVTMPLDGTKDNLIKSNPDLGVSLFPEDSVQVFL